MKWGKSFVGGAARREHCAPRGARPYQEPPLLLCLRHTLDAHTTHFLSTASDLDKLYIVLVYRAVHSLRIEVRLQCR